MKRDLLLFILFAASTIIATAQNGACPGYAPYHDPEPPTSPFGSGLYAPSITASSAGNSSPAYPTGSCINDPHFYSYNACQAASSTSGTVYTYTFGFYTSTAVYGYILNCVGGYVTSAALNESGGHATNYGSGFPYPGYTQPSGGNSAVGTNGYYATSLVVTVRWTTASASNSLQFYGYGVSVPMGTDYHLTGFMALTVNTSSFPTAPAEPTAIDLGSPVCSVPGWSLDPISPADTFVWGYNGGLNQGGQMGKYPNPTYPYSYGPTIPNNNPSSAVTVNLCVYALSHQNSCAADQPSPSYCSSISIPGSSTGCGGGGGWHGSIEPGLTSSDSTATLELKNSVYPNPATNAINLTFDKAANHTVELVSVLGQVCKKIADQSADKIQMDVSTLPKGVYFIVIYENKMIVSRKKIVIQ